MRLFRGFGSVEIPFGVPFLQIAMLTPVWADGTLALIVSLFLVNLLVLLEVADRLSLKGELEVAREIQLAMLPSGTYSVGDIQICGMTRPANTVGGDFYDVLTLRDGRVIVTIGDVAGKGSPAALLMALLLAVMRTLVDEELDPPALVERLNVQICRHSPSSRFITLFYAVYTPSTGALTYVNAGQNPPLIRRRDGRYERLGSTGVALGMFDHSVFGAVDTALESGEIARAVQRWDHRSGGPVGAGIRGGRPRAGRRAPSRCRPGGNLLAGGESSRSAREGFTLHRRLDYPGPETGRPSCLTTNSQRANSQAASADTGFAGGQEILS